MTARTVAGLSDRDAQDVIFGQEISDSDCVRFHFLRETIILVLKVPQLINHQDLRLIGFYFLSYHCNSSWLHMHELYELFSAKLTITPYRFRWSDRDLCTCSTDKPAEEPLTVSVEGIFV